MGPSSSLIGVQAEEGGEQAPDRQIVGHDVGRAGGHASGGQALMERGGQARRSDLDRAGPDRANPDQRAAGPLATARRACLDHGYRDGSSHKVRGNARQQHPVMRALPGPAQRGIALHATRLHVIDVTQMCQPKC